VSDNGAEGSAATTGTGSDGVVRGAWHAPVSPGTPYVDQGFVDLLIAAGHTIQRFNPQSGRLSADDVPLLNAYDLVVLGSALNSGPFNLLAQGSKWNTDIRAPMLITKSTLVRANRLGLLQAATTATEYDSAADDPKRTASGKLTFHVPSHPVFAGIPATETAGGRVMNDFCGIRIAIPPNNRSTSVQFYQLSINGTDQGISNILEPGGVNLATLDFNPLDPGVNIPAGQTPALHPTDRYEARGYGIAEWPAGITVRTTQAADILAGYRMLFSCGTRDASGSVTSAPNPQAGALDLTPAGQQMFLQAVQHALRQPPAGPNRWTNQPGGNFLWNQSSQNWLAPTVWTDGADAIFTESGAGPILIDAPVTARDLFFGAPGYSLSSTNGSSLLLTEPAEGRDPVITTHAPAAISAELAGSDGLTLRGSSELTLAGLNTISGGTRILSGTVTMKSPTSGNNASPFALDAIDALERGATLRYFNALDPTLPYTTSSNLRAANGQLHRYSRLVMTGGTFDLNGDDNQNQMPAPSGTGIITNNSPLARAVLKIGAPAGSVTTFSGIIQNGNNGNMVVSVVPNSATAQKQGYRTDIDLAAMDGSSVFILDNANTYSGFTRIGSGLLTFTDRGRWGVPVTTGDPITSSPNGTIICNGTLSDLRVDFNGTSQTTGGLSGNGGVFANNRDGTLSILTVGAANLSNTVWPTGGGGQNGRIADNTNGGTGRVGLTKTGSGTIGLPTAQLTYSGPTRIEQGVLEFTATGAPSPASPIEVSPGAQLRLSFSGSRTVAGFSINGRSQPAGTICSAATHPDAISGPGSIVIAGISVTTANGSVTITWGGDGTLQESTDLQSWTDLPGAFSPLTQPATPGRRYFRLRP
jgi:autotransporter-associated beta strand protein